MKKALCLIFAAAILTGSANFAFAENSDVTAAKTDAVLAADNAAAQTDAVLAADDAAALDSEVELFASIDGITFELDPSQSLEGLTRVVKVKYDRTYFTEGINDFKVQIRAVSNNISGISYTTKLSGGGVSDSYENGIYTCSGSFDYDKIPSDGCLFTMTITLKERLLTGFTISLTGDTYLSDSTGMTQRLSTGGINPASLEVPGHSNEETFSGTDGAVTYDYDGVSTLTLHGNGTMTDYAQGEAPWYKKAVSLGCVDKITNIVFKEDRLNNVGTYAFYGFNKVTSITLSNDIYTINKGAFEGCSSLKNITFNSNPGVGIGEDAFKNCSALTSVTVPDNVTSIGTGAFEGCSSLNSITLPFIGFQRTKGSNDTFKVIFNGNVPSSLRRVTITDDTIVPDSAFEGCSRLTSISLNSGITSIGTKAFKDCTSLTALEIPAAVTEIKDYTFQNCSSLYVMDISENVNAIGTGAFDGCSGLRSIYIPSGITQIRDYTFRGCSSLKEIEIPVNVTDIGVSVLEGCSSLIDVKVPFVGANNDPGSTTVTDEGIFGYFFGVTDNSNVPASVTKVEITSTNRNNYIPKCAFKDCGNIEDIIINGGRNILDSAFENCKMLKHLYIPSSISTISYGSNLSAPILKGCTRLTTLTIPFVGTNRLDKNTETAVVGALFGYDDSDGAGTMQYYNSNQDFHIYKVPRTLKTVNLLNQTDIPTGAFMGCDFIENIAVVTGAVMNDYAFYQCASLKNAVLPNDLTTIGYEAFAECENLENINIPAKVKTIGSNAFYNCTSLKNVTMPDSITTIASDVFNGSSLDPDRVRLMADTAAITCSYGSGAYNFAVENGIATNVVDSRELDVKTVGATADKLSTGEYLIDVVDTNGLTGTVYAAVYDANDKMLAAKLTPAAKGTAEYRLTFSPEETEGISYVKVFVLGGGNGMTPLTSECTVISDIPS